MFPPDGSHEVLKFGRRIRHLCDTGEVDPSKDLEKIERTIDLRFWKEFPTDKELGAGVIDVKAFKAESAADVAERIRAMLTYVAPEKLWLNPDCGFWETPRWVVKQKLAALVQGAAIVRKELGGA